MNLSVTNSFNTKYNKLTCFDLRVTRFVMHLLGLVLPFKSFMTFIVFYIFCFYIRGYLCLSVSRMSFFVSLRALRGKQFFLFFIVVPTAPCLLSVFAIHKVFHEAGYRQVSAVSGVPEGLHAHGVGQV